jgi:hypothetical protein
VASPVGLLATIAPAPPTYASAEFRRTAGSDCLEFTITAPAREVAPYFQALAGPTPKTRPARLLLSIRKDAGKRSSMRPSPRGAA